MYALHRYARFCAALPYVSLNEQGHWAVLATLQEALSITKR